MPERPWKGHDLKYAVASCSFPKFMIYGRLFYLFSLQVINTIYKRESAVCSAHRSRAHNQKNLQLRSLLEQRFLTFSLAGTPFEPTTNSRPPFRVDAMQDI